MCHIHVPDTHDESTYYVLQTIWIKLNFNKCKNQPSHKFKHLNKYLTKEGIQMTNKCKLSLNRTKKFLLYDCQYNKNELHISSKYIESFNFTYLIINIWKDRFD